MAGYIGSKTSVTVISPQTDSRYVNVTGDTMTTDGATVLTVDRATSDGTIIDLQKDGSSVGSIGVTGDDFYLTKSGSNQTGIYFNELGMLPMTSGSISDNSRDIGQSGYRFKNLYLSGGVYLGGTGAANYLDDYEEGTFTPAFATGGGSADASTKLGFYTKVGQTVFFSIRMASITVSSPSGLLYISQLPFTASSQGGTACVCSPYNLASGAYSPTMEVINGASYGVLFGFNNGVRNDNMAGYLQTNSQLLVAGHYYTTA